MLGSQKILCLQHYYTSSEYGLSGGKGFQTVAMSEGISEEERIAIERGGAYFVSPLYLSTPEKFPVKLAFYRLPSGRFAISRSVYTGKDYSGRDGNYFSHTLVFSEFPPNLNPVLMFYFDSWKESYDYRQGSILPPTQIDLENLERKKKKEFPTFRNFLMEKKEYAQTLIERIYTKKIKEKEEEPILIIDDFQNIIYWLFLIYEVFPPKFLKSLSFSTYEEEEATGSLFDIVANPLGEGTGYNILNFQENTVNHECKNDYASFAVDLLLRFPTVLKEFLTDVDSLIDSPSEFEYAYKLLWKGEIRTVPILSLPDKFKKVAEKRLISLPVTEIEKVLEFNFKTSSDKERTYNYFRDLFTRENREDFLSYLLKAALPSLKTDKEKIEFLVRNKDKIPLTPHIKRTVEELFPFNFPWWQSETLALEAYQLLKDLGITIPEDLNDLYLLEQKLSHLNDEELVFLSKKLLRKQDLTAEKRKKLINEIFRRESLWEEENYIQEITPFFTERERKKLLEIMDCNLLLARFIKILPGEEIRSWLKIVPSDCLENFMNSEECTEEIRSKIEKELPFLKSLNLRLFLLFKNFFTKKGKKIKKKRK